MGIVIGVRYAKRKALYGLLLPNGSIMKQSFVSESMMDNYKINFQAMKVENGIHFSPDGECGASRGLQKLWIYLFDYFIHIPALKFLSPYHALVQNKIDDQNNVCHSISRPINASGIHPDDFIIDRAWSWNSSRQQWCTAINIFNTLSTDTFAGPCPCPSKTFVQVFIHIFVKGLDQLRIKLGFIEHKYKNF